MHGNVLYYHTVRYCTHTRGTSTGGGLDAARSPQRVRCIIAGTGAWASSELPYLSPSSVEEHRATRAQGHMGVLLASSASVSASRLAEAESEEQMRGGGGMDDR